VSKETSRILEKIKALEEEKARLLPLRKEEIFNVLQSNGGLTLDNKLLAGLAIHAANPANATSNILRELTMLGQTKMPSKGNREATKTPDTSLAASSYTVKKEKVHG
jgi:hypothetical protein